MKNTRQCLYCFLFKMHSWKLGWTPINAKNPCFMFLPFHFILRYNQLQRRQWQPTPIFLPGKSHGRRNLVGCSPWCCNESDTSKQLPFHFSLSCIGEGNDNPLQWGILENPRDGGAWWLPSMWLHRVGHDWNDLAAA